jgi:phospholipase C
MCAPSDATSSENGLPADYYQYLLTGGTNQTSKTPDTRITDVNSLPPVPFQLTSKMFAYDAYAASPVHRFYQIWQQLDCNVSYATALNPGGCLGDLFPWVEVTVGAGTNGLAQPRNFSAD